MDQDVDLIISRNAEMVELGFSEPATYLEFSPDSARKIAHALLRNANEIDGKEEASE